MGAMAFLYTHSYSSRLSLLISETSFSFAKAVMDIALGALGQGHRMKRMCSSSSVLCQEAV